MRDPLISVIIPVYQAEKTIERCVSSIVSHRAPIEIVCVDDGSKDQSLGILQSLARDNDCLNIFHQDNAGAAAARNKGLSVARGEYVMFCDADDAYFEDTIDLITEDIEKYQADYIVFGRQSTTLDNHVVTCHKGDQRTNWKALGTAI